MHPRLAGFSYKSFQKPIDRITCICYNIDKIKGAKHSASDITEDGRSPKARKGFSMYKESIKWMFYHWARVKKLRPKTKKSVERFANTLNTTHFILTNTTFNDESKHSECKGFYEGYIRALYEADIITQGVYEEIQDLVADYEEE